MADVEGIDAGVISQALMTKHAPPEWATFVELRDSTGFGQSRTIDVAAFNTWKSSGYSRIAYEVKVSRGDFIRELDNPAKHAWVEQYFHETYFAAPAGLIKKDEVPALWGLIEVYRQKGGEVVTRRAVRAKRRAPDDFNVGLTLSILRRAAKQVHDARAKVYLFEGDEVTPDEMREIVDGRVAAALEPERESVRHLRDRATRKYEEATELETKLRDPLAQLRSRANVGHWERPRLEDMTADDVDRMIDEAVRERLKQRMRAIQQAHAALGALQDIGESS